MPSRSHVIGCNFFGVPSNPRGQKRAPSIPLEQKGNRPHLDRDLVHGEDETSSESSFGASIPLGVIVAAMGFIPSQR